MPSFCYPHLIEATESPENIVSTRAEYLLNIGDGAGVTNIHGVYGIYSVMVSLRCIQCNDPNINSRVMLVHLSTHLTPYTYL